MELAQGIVRVIAAIETRIYCEGIVNMLNNVSSIDVITTVGRSDNIPKICTDRQADVLLLDSGFDDAIGVIRSLKVEEIPTKIILLAVTACRIKISNFACEGVKEFVTSEDSMDDLRHCIEASIGSGFWCSSRVADVLFNSTQTPMEMAYNADHLDLTSLTPQQTTVLHLIESGHTNKDIARKLNIETATVKNHVHQILQRMQVNTRGEAAAIFRRHTA